MDSNGSGVRGMELVGLWGSGKYAGKKAREDTGGGDGGRGMGRVDM